MTSNDTLTNRHDVYAHMGPQKRALIRALTFLPTVAIAVWLKNRLTWYFAASLAPYGRLNSLYFDSYQGTLRHEIPTLWQGSSKWKLHKASRADAQVAGGPVPKHDSLIPLADYSREKA